MIDLWIAVVSGFFYFTGQYGTALLLIVLAIISGRIPGRSAAASTRRSRTCRRLPAAAAAL
jgi:hypothetical protein